MRFLPRAVLGIVSTLLFACGVSTPKPEELPAPPAILSFTADQTRVAEGQSVTLSFKARGAQTAVLTDQKGQEIPLSGDASEGGAVVTPAESTFYVLRVTGAGGGDTAFVQVAVNEELKDVFLVAAPSAINSGGSTQLLWSAFHAQSANIQSSAGEQFPLDTTQGSGVIDVSPARTTSYSLTGNRYDEAINTSTKVSVAPVVLSFNTFPAAAKPGELLSLSWKTAGASTVTLSESTFGELSKVSVPLETDQVDEGGFGWQVPATLPDGTTPTRDGQPLHFTLTVTTEDPALTVTRTLDSFVGEGPRIMEFLAPQAVTAGQKVALSWQTTNAERLQILANGLVVFEPLYWQQDLIAKGSVSLPQISGTTKYTLVVHGHERTQVSQTNEVRVVSQPVIDAFTLPATITNVGDAAAAAWTTHDATAVTLRVKNGPVLFTSTDLVKVTNGSASVFPGVRATFVLEAWNSSGVKATSERTVNVTNPGTISGPASSATVGDPVTISWSLLGGANVRDVIGDPNSAVGSADAPQDFYDLATDPDATALYMPDADESVSRLRLPLPFRFPFLGPVMENFFVSTNGFVAFAPTAPLPTNGDLASTTLSHPAMIAPFWDDLRLGNGGRILYRVEGTAFPRRLIIQWDKVHTVAAGSELTFQVQLLESGEFKLAYKSLNGTDADGSQATVGWRANQSLGFNSSRNTAAAVTPGLALSFFGSGAAVGQVTSKFELSGAFTLFTKMLNGTHVVYPARVYMLAPGSVLVNEVMAAPAASAPQGQWVELFNTTNDTVDLTGTTLLSTTGTAGPVTRTGASTVVVDNAGSTPFDAYNVILTVVGPPIRSSGAPILPGEKLDPGTATFTYSLDNGTTTSAAVFVPASGSYAIPNSGLKLSFGTGDYYKGDTYSFTCVTTTSSFALPAGLTVPPQGYLVIGQSLDLSSNGGAPVQLVANGFNIPSQGGLLELVTTGTISSLGYTTFTPTAGASLQWGGGLAMDASGSRSVCPTRTQTFGAAGSSFGTPGKTNEACFPYTLQQIKGAFEDITSFGTSTPGLYANMRGEFLLDLTPAPFTFFGSPRYFAWYSGAGELTFDVNAPPQLPTGYDNPVSPSDPQFGGLKGHGMIAPFWDMIHPTSVQGLVPDILTAHLPPKGNLPARWIIQWNHFTKDPNSKPGYITISADDDADFNFQVKLFEDGSIEYHYGVMRYGVKQPIPPYGQGATIWLAAPDFSAALPVGINQPVVRDNVAFRFAPIQ